MSYVLGKPIRAGRFTITVVSRQTVAGQKIGQRGFALFCAKAPAYVVVQDGPDRMMMDMTGAKVTAEEVRAVCPAIAAL